MQLDSLFVEFVVTRHFTLILRIEKSWSERWTKKPKPNLKPPDVQNIDLMNLAGFCRNCLSNWYKDAAEERGIDLDKMAAREIVYGMPYDEWKEKHQTEASPEKLASFEQHNH